MRTVMHRAQVAKMGTEEGGGRERERELSLFHFYRVALRRSLRRGSGYERERERTVNSIMLEYF